MGGIETYTVRLAKHLSQHIQVKILILSNKYNDALLEEASKYATIYFIHDYTIPTLLRKNTFIKRVAFLFPIDYKKLIFDLKTIHYTHATGSEGLVVSNNLLKYNEDIRISLGIYHSKEFTWSSNAYFRNIEKSLFLFIHNKNMISPNESSLPILESYYKKKFDLPIVPIGIKIPSKEKAIFNPNSNKIISIGRLVEFKTYNEHIINIIDDINNIHEASYEYHIYGYGPNEEKLKKLADTKNSKIIFHGILEYSKIQNILSDCILFVGSGTAIIEASSFGIPSIIGIESNKQSETYGLFSDLVGFSYNEDNLDIKKTKYINIANNFFKLDKGQKTNISYEHMRKAKEFSIDTTSILFLKALEQLRENKYYTYSRFRYKLSYLLWLIKNKLNINHEMKNRYEK